MISDQWKSQARSEFESHLGRSLESLPGDKEWVYTAMRERASVLRLEAELATLREENARLKWLFSAEEIDEFCSELGAPQYRETDDGEARYWCFSGCELPVADNLSELLFAARDLQQRAELALNAPPAGKEGKS